MPVYKSKKGYFVQINYTDAEGKYRQKKKTGFATQREAKAWEREFLSNELNFTCTAKFSKMVEMYLEDLKTRVKASTYQVRLFEINNSISPYWKDYRLSDITIKEVEKWQRTLVNSSYKSSTILRDQVNFKTILKFAMKMDMFHDMKIMNLPNRKKLEQKAEMLFWELDEFNKFIDVVDDIRYRAIYYILYSCGLRVGELMALQWKDISFENHYLKVNKTYDYRNKLITPPKTTNSNRLVLIPNKCIEAITLLYKHDSKCMGFSEDSFISGFDKPISTMKIKRHKDNYCKLAGVKQIRIHDFRHSHVSLLISLGFSPFDIAKRLGHSVDMVNNRYGHWFKDAQLKMVEKLNETL